VEEFRAIAFSDFSMKGLLSFDWASDTFWLPVGVIYGRSVLSRSTEAWLSWLSVVTMLMCGVLELAVRLYFSCFYLAETAPDRP